jgi:hypothetical protein
MPVRDVAHLGLEEVEVLGDLGSDLLHGQHVDPSRRQQDAERQPTCQAKDFRQGVHVPGLEHESGPDPLGGIDEQLDAAHLEGPARRLPGCLEAGQGEDGFPRHVQLRARRDHHLDLWRGLQDLRDDGGTLDEMLEVVEEEQLALVGQVGQQLGLHVLIG